MALIATVFSERWEVTKRLAELGLEQGLLGRPVQRGLASWASCTANHPPVSPGSWAWAETVCGLRDELLPLKWQRSNEANLPLTISPDGSMAICVNTGDEDTGRKNGAPCTSSAKGPRTRSAVLENLGQEVLFVDALPSSESVSASGRAMWILLFYRDKKTREVRCELSCPINISTEGYVDGWKERIILTPTPFDEDVLNLIGDGEGPQSPEINVEIKKRG